VAKQVKTINAEIGARIKQHRLSQKMTRDELARLSGYSANFVQEVELGRSGLSSESIKAFSVALHVSTDDLLFGNTLDGFGHLLEKLKSVPVEKRKHIFKIIDEAIECTK